MKHLFRLMALYRPLYGWMALGVLLSLATLLANVTLMAVSGWFITSMALAGVAQTSMNYFTPAALIRGAAIVRTVGRYGERLVTHEATLKLLARLRSWFYQRLEPLAPAALAGHQSGDLLSRLRADIDTLDNLYLRLLVPGVTAALAVLIITLFLATYDPVVAGVLFGLLVTAGMVVPLITFRLGRKPGERKVTLLAEQRSLLVDSTQGLGELSLYGATETYRDRIGRNSGALATEQAKLAGVDGLSQAATLFLANLAMWLVLWLSIPKLDAGLLAKADLAMLALLGLAAFEAIMPLPLALRVYGETLAAIQRLFEIVDLRPPVRNPANPVTEASTSGVVFERVSFAYPEAEREALVDIDLRIPAGARVLVRGASGSGKTTLVQLLVRFYDPHEGSIQLGGVDLRQWDVEALRQQLSVVSQGTHVFTGTIRDNLIIARPGASESAMHEACRIAQAHGFIEALPDGYDTWVGEAGSTLSGGEGRRLAIARALLKDSPIWVLDEPTEGLDATTAVNLIKALDRAAAGKTVLVITHQSLQGIDFDSEIHLRDGRVVK